MVRTSQADFPATGDNSEGAQRWVAIGWSTDIDPERAARQALREALGGEDPKLIVAFCAATCEPQAVIAGLSPEAGSIPLIGCSTDSVITPDGLTTQGVAVVTLGGGGLSVATSADLVSGGRAREAGAAVADCVAEVRNRRYRTLLLLTDGFVSEQELILSGVYGVVGASIPLIGGSASPTRGGDRTFQIHGGESMTQAVIGAAIGSDAPLGISLRHGWRRFGEPMVVTHSDNGLVKTLNDQPALSTYLHRLGAPPEAYEDPVVFQAFARTRPIGVSRRIGEDLRDVSSSDYFEEGWLYSSAEIPEGGLVWLMAGDTQSVLDAAGAAVDAAADALGGSAPLGMLAFDCVSRSAILGQDGTRREVANIVEPGVPIVGMYTWGEIARTQGINAYHNLTLAILALG